MTTTNMSTCIISCHCGASRQSIELALGHDGGNSQVTGPGRLDISICHCYACRHVTGQMFASWVGIQAPVGESYCGLKAYAVDHVTDERFTDKATHYFCGVCGCHVLRSISRPLDSKRDDRRPKERDEITWEVATGVIVEDFLSTHGGQDTPDLPGQVPGEISWRHQNVNETKGGGLFPWLSHASGHSVEATPQRTGSVASNTELMSSYKNGINTTSTSSTTSNLQTSNDENQNKNEKEEQKATCHCGTISLAISRPNKSPIPSTAPRSNFPDLMYQYISTPESVISNPGDVKWWLRGPSTTDGFPTRYLAGTCACRSCRLTSGFEIQSWAFIPRGNISISVLSAVSASSEGDEAGTKPPTRRRKLVPLVFPTAKTSAAAAASDDTPALPLKSYESSPGVVREFCPVCGATVFWHDKWRPDLMDVSVGLFRFPGDSDSDPDAQPRAAGGTTKGDGARNESWLDWWTERVSFAEDAGLDRSGFCSLWGKELIKELGEGLKGGRSVE